ncbi:PIR protein [Plasmodium vivax]|uniref:VIR protein n=1 Tax=Plasmodium vivax TaxID=5855 RepID=A0A565A3R9_PLAVI|nr:PIR protein [Plasmodium vivax]
MAETLFLNIINLEKYEDKLPSNSFKKKLLKDFKFDEMKSTFQLPNPHDSQCWVYINNIGSTLYINYRTIVNSDCKNNKNTKCCRDINYYLDLIIGIIKSSKLKEEDKTDYIKQVENHWRERFVRAHNNDCKREERSYSIEKRSILKHLYDVCEDKIMPGFNPVSYNEHLKNKWNEIINSNSSNIEDLSFHIKGKSLNKKVKYRDFLLNFEGIECPGNDNINLSDILAESETFEEKLHVDIPSSPEDSAEIDLIPESLPEDPVTKTENGNSNILDLKNLPITFVSLSGIGSFFFILYKYSPLGSWLYRNVTNKNKLSANMNYKPTQEDLERMLHSTYINSPDHQYNIAYTPV